MKNITLQQGLILAVCVVVPVIAYKFLGSPEAAAASMLAGMVINFLLGRGDPPPPSDGGGGGGVGSNVRPIGFLAALGLSVCTLGCLVEPKDPTDALTDCAEEARNAYYQDGATEAEAMAVYDNCLARKGF